MGDRKLRVLVADDHEQARWAMAYLLHGECDVVAESQTALNWLKQQCACGPTCVSDVSMPSLSGPQAMDQLKGKGSNIPFVLVSADSSDKKQLIQQGASAFVAKIDTGRELLTTVFAAAGRVERSRMPLEPLNSWMSTPGGLVS